jgi:hypothetical protein
VRRLAVVFIQEAPEQRAGVLDALAVLVGVPMFTRSPPSGRATRKGSTIGSKTIST